jgi:hypothetical protein
MLHVIDDETQFDANLGRQVRRAAAGRGPVQAEQGHWLWWFGRLCRQVHVAACSRGGLLL